VSDASDDRHLEQRMTVTRKIGSKVEVEDQRQKKDRADKKKREKEEDNK